MTESGPVNLTDLYQSIRNRLRESGHDSADTAARDLIKRVVDIADIDIVLQSSRTLSAAKVMEIDMLLDRLLSGEPVSRIFAEREFWGIPFSISPAVLDPRPDTETIVDTAIKRFFGAPPESVLDLGTGSGCIIIALLTEWPQAVGIASDISPEALHVAKNNAVNVGVAERIKFVKADWGDSVSGNFDLIVSNPPYIPSAEIPNLAAAVKNYDPILALDGGVDGLSCYRHVIPAIKKRLRRGGTALLEIGISQAADVARLVEKSGLCVDRIIPDFVGIQRVVEISFGDK